MEFAGAWRRTDLHIGGRLRDDADVLWLQTSEWYADLRIPHDDHGGPIEAFAGPARWVEPLLHLAAPHRLGRARSPTTSVT